jgi:hypothetical protein
MGAHTNDRRSRLHAALDRLLDGAAAHDSILGAVEQSVKRATPSVTGALTTEPRSIGSKDERLQRAYDSIRTR